MEQITEFIHSHVQYAPLIIFFVLCLAGLCVPVSEDGVLFITALLAKSNPDLFYILFFAAYSGVYISDLIAYGLGRKLGPELWRIRFFARWVPRKNIDRMHGFYKKYGIITLFIGRFIPFGVRNALFITAGLGRMPIVKFLFFDLAAATTSCVIYFYLYYTYGEAIIDTIKKANIFLLLVVMTAGLIFWFFVKKRKKS